MAFWNGRGLIYELFSLHSRGPIHEAEYEDAVDPEHEQKEDGLVEIVKLDECGQGQDGHDPDVDKVLRGVFMVRI